MVKVGRTRMRQSAACFGIMRGMMPFTHWSAILPPLTPRLSACVSTTGSLTEYLQATGRAFSVQVLQQGPSRVSADEAAVFDLIPGAAIYARHVCLQLDGMPVVVARSLCLPDCAVWYEVLDRGSRSLGYTLFGGETALTRGELSFAMTGAGELLHSLAQQYAPETTLPLPARRCAFELGGETLMVCEVFLPQLESFL